MRRFSLIALAITLVVRLAFAQERVLKPPDTLKLDGVPKIPASLGDSIQGYQASSPDYLVGWDPTKIEPQFVRHFHTGRWELFSVATPGGAPTRICSPPARSYDTYNNPQRRYFVFEVDASAGSERMQLYGYDPANNTLGLLTDGRSKNYHPVFSNSGKQMMYSSTRRNGKDMDIYVIDPLDAKSDHLVAQLDGENWAALDWSPDDQKVILSEYMGAGESYLWILDVATGMKTRLTDPLASGGVFNGSNAQFSKDAKGVYHITDRDSDLARLAYVDIATKRESYLTQIDWDTEEFALSPDRRLVAFTINQNGFSRLHILDTAKKNKEIHLDELPAGVIQKLSWHKNSRYVAFGFSSGTVPGDIYSVDIRNGKLQRWTSNGQAVLEGSPKPELIKWESFDGKYIPGFLYRPPAVFSGPRPVIIDVHGGPSDQFRPGFRGSDNFFTFELGAVMIYPNIRGSTGYGKAYLKSDNGYLREDAIKDIGSLLDWIKVRPELDAERILIRGESYGGYVALSVAANYSDRIRGAISASGPSNLVSFLETTDGSRQDSRRAEYGDERDPQMRRFLNGIAPSNKAEKVKRPLLVIQGRNDTRVAFSEAEQMVVSVRKVGTPVWYVLALNEGHGWVSVRNKHFSACTEASFARGLLAGEQTSR